MIIFFLELCRFYYCDYFSTVVIVIIFVFTTFLLLLSLELLLSIIAIFLCYLQSAETDDGS